MKLKKTITQTALILGALTLVPNAQAQSWESLPADSQSTLRPLRLAWSELSDAQKQSWLKLVPELQAMPTDQLTTAQERMSEWTALSDQQRAQIQEHLKKSKKISPAVRATLWKSYTGQ